MGETVHLHLPNESKRTNTTKACIHTHRRRLGPTPHHRLYVHEESQSVDILQSPQRIAEELLKQSSAGKRGGFVHEGVRFPRGLFASRIDMKSNLIPRRSMVSVSTFRGSPISRSGFLLVDRWTVSRKGTSSKRYRWVHRSHGDQPRGWGRRRPPIVDS